MVSLVQQFILADRLPAADLGSAGPAGGRAGGAAAAAGVAALALEGRRRAIRREAGTRQPAPAAVRGGGPRVQGGLVEGREREKGGQLMPALPLPCLGIVIAAHFSWGQSVILRLLRLWLDGADGGEAACDSLHGPHHVEHGGLRRLLRCGRGGHHCCAVLRSRSRPTDSGRREGTGLAGRHTGGVARWVTRRSGPARQPPSQPRHQPSHPTHSGHTTGAARHNVSVEDHTLDYIQMQHVIEGNNIFLGEKIFICFSLYPRTLVFQSLRRPLIEGD